MSNNKIRVGTTMRNLHELEDIALIDMLAEHTLMLTHLFRVRKGLFPNKEYINCRDIIEGIMVEIEKRGLLPKHIDPFILG